MTPRRLLAASAIVQLCALGLAFYAGRATAPRDRTEHTRQTQQERQGEAQTTAKGSEAAEGTREAQERSGEREEERRPDGTVRVVTRWKQGETKERVVVQKVVEWKERIEWKTRTEIVEKRVEVKAPPVPLPRWSLSIGPASALSRRTFASTGSVGFATAASVRAIGPLWLTATATRAGGEWTAAALLGVTFP